MCRTVVAVLPLLFAGLVFAEEKISEFPQPYTVQESTKPGECLVWLKAGDWSTQVMQTDIHHCHTWEKGELVHATFPNGDQLYLLVHDAKTTRDERCGAEFCRRSMEALSNTQSPSR